LDAQFGGMKLMGYFDGNTVTASVKLPPIFAMSDHSYSTTFGRRRRLDHWFQDRRTV